MKHAYIIAAAILLPMVAVAQQAQAPTAAQECTSSLYWYSVNYADINLRMNQLSGKFADAVQQLKDANQQLKDAETKVTADDVLIKSLREQLARAGVKEPKPEDGKPSEPSAPSPEAK